MKCPARTQRAFSPKAKIQKIPDEVSGAKIQKETIILNWDKAKNLIIMFLCLLNIFLSVTYYMQRNNYVLSPEQENAIVTLLSQNKISMYTKIQREYKPIRQLQTTGYKYEDEHLIKVFFNNAPNVVQITESNKTIYSLEDITLTNQNGYITYENSSAGRSNDATNNTAGYVESISAAVTLCDSFIKKLYDSPFVLETQLVEDDGYYLLYRNLFDNTVIYSNFISFHVNIDGITQAETMFSRPMGYKGRAINICSSDEALFTFMQQVRRAYGDREIFIDKMEFVYYQEQGQELNGDNASQDNPPAAIPCYRISVWRQNMAQDTAYLINAYTNTLIT